jgi:Family of unknown function (DUF5694)
MKAVTRCVVSAILLAGTLAATAGQQSPAQVMLFGVFHFANPGHDLVKTDQIDVMSKENQAYLEALTARISKFNPTVVLLEFDPEREAEMQERYRRYLEGSYDLPSNEVYQLGFRIAARSDAGTIHAFDETSVQWQAEPLFDYMATNDTETGARMTALIEEITADEQEAQTTLSLQALLARANDADRDALNRAMYLMTNQVGDDDNFVGADATASWWHRNFRMYARVQRYAKPGERVLVIGGQGHIAILRQLLADDRERVAVDVLPYLQ